MLILTGTPTRAISEVAITTIRTNYEAYEVTIIESNVTRISLILGGA